MIFEGRLDGLCCQALDATETCTHKDRYLGVVEYVRSEGIPVGYAPDAAAGDSWLVAGRG